jgi:hypothetical protein
MAQDNRLVQEFQENGLVFDIGSEGGGGNGQTSLSGLYGGIMPYRQAPEGGLSDGLAEVSGVGSPGETDNVNKHPINRNCVFENELHHLAQGQWWKQDQSGVWTQIGTFEDAHTAYQNIGIYPIFNQATNKRYIVSAYLTNTNGTRNWKPVRYNPETQTLETGIEYTSLFNSATALTPSECQMGNDIYFAGHDEASSVLVLNGNNLTIHRVAFTDIVGGNVHRPIDLCAYSGQVYMAHKNLNGSVAGSGVITISEVVPLPRTLLELPFAGYSQPAVNSTSDVARQRCLLFVDNNPVTSSGQLNGLGQANTPSLWLYYQTNPQIDPVHGGSAGVEGYSVWQLQGDGNGGLSVIQQVDNLMGSYSAGFGEDQIPVGNNDQAVISICDNYPGWFLNAPEKPFLTMRPMGGEPGQTFKQWDFDPQGSGFPPAGQSIGGPAKVSFVQDKLGGGARWSPAAPSLISGNDVNIFDIVYSSGLLIGTDTWRIYYDLMDSTAYPTGTAVNVRWYHDKFHAPKNRCSLSGTSHGVLSNNEAVDVVFESGATYYVDWKISDNNLQQRDRVYLVGLAYISGADIGSL